MSKRIPTIVFTGFLLLILMTAVNADVIKFARFPHINQGKIVFTYHGDIWLSRSKQLH